MGDKLHEPEPTLDEMLADPMIWTVMKSDGVEERALRNLLAGVAADLARGGKPVAGVEGVSGPLGAYRPGVGIMMLNRRHEVLVGQRIDAHGEAWQMPQGGIDGNEDPRDAAFRELREEIGSDKAEIIAETKTWLRYDLPPELRKRWNGRFCGQQQKWFVMRFLGEDSDINLATAQPEFSAWKWVPVESLPDLIVAFKRQLYVDLLGELQASAAIGKATDLASRNNRSGGNTAAKPSETRSAQPVEKPANGAAESQVALARGHVTDGQQIVADQRHRIAALRADGHDTTRAESLLAQLERSLALFEADLKRLQEEKAK